MTQAAKPIRVLAVDDHPLVREGIAALIATREDMLLVAEASGGAEAIEAYALHRPDVTLMDLRLPGVNGIDAIEAIRKDFPGARIVVLTSHAGDVLAQKALRAGARAYLLKETLRRNLLDTIERVHGGQQHVDPAVAVELARHALQDRLSDREVEVLRLVAEGNSNKVIGRLLDVTEGTVKSHVRNVLAKLDAKDRTHAVALALERGIIGV